MPDDPDLFYLEGKEDMKQAYADKKNRRLHSMIILVAGVIFINLTVIIIVRKRMKRQMQDQVSTSVQGAVDEYFALAQSATETSESQ